MATSLSDLGSTLLETAVQRMRTASSDALVIGAGVAGCAAALVLAEHHSVTLVDRVATPTPRIGESLPSAARALLLRLGVSEEFEAASHRLSLGKASVWGSHVPVYRDAFIDPLGSGWCLDRLQFETMLRDATRARGVQMIAPARITGLMRRTDGAAGWRARLHTQDADFSFDAKCVLLAHGRGTPPVSFDASLEVRASDRLVCRFVRVPSVPGLTTRTGFSLVEAVEEGWWYQATLPDGQHVVAYHTDSDLPSARQSCHANGFAALLRRTHTLGAIQLPPTAQIAGASARSQVLDSPWGVNWCAVGDAACAFDPLSSQGLFHALYSGVRGAESIVAAMNGDPLALPAYGLQLAKIVEAYATNKQRFYGSETRFSNSAFWARRRHVLGTRTRDVDSIA